MNEPEAVEVAQPEEEAANNNSEEQSVEEPLQANELVNRVPVNDREEVKGAENAKIAEEEGKHA